MTTPSIQKVGVERWTLVFGREQDYSNFHHYAFQWIDELSHFLDAEEVLVGWTLKDLFLLHFRKAFAAAGWSGEGRIGLHWLPPFCASGAPSSGFYIVHARRKHDGMSWIASRYPLYGLEPAA
jgi:hypothetical protein